MKVRILKYIIISVLTIALALGIILPNIVPTNADDGIGGGQAGGVGTGTGDVFYAGYTYVWHDNATQTPEGTWTSTDVDWLTYSEVTTLLNSTISRINTQVVGDLNSVDLKKTFTTFMNKAKPNLTVSGQTHKYEWVELNFPGTQANKDGSGNIQNRTLELQKAMLEAMKNALEVAAANEGISPTSPDFTQKSRVVGIAFTLNVLEGWVNAGNHVFQFGQNWSKLNESDPTDGTWNTFDNLFEGKSPQGITGFADEWNQEYYNTGKTWAKQIYDLNKAKFDGVITPQPRQFYAVAVTNTQPAIVKNGYIQMTKETDDTSLYPPTGAQYSVYDTKAKADAAGIGNPGTGTNAPFATITINSNGTHEPLEIDLQGQTSRVVYLKETKLPNKTGDFDWIPDTSTITCTVTKNHTEEVPYKFTRNNSVNEYGYIRIKKEVPPNKEAVGATFGVYKSASDANSNSNRLTTLTINANGYSDTYKVKLPQGVNKSLTVYVKELTTPTQTGDFNWIKDNSIKQATITKSNTNTVPYTFNFKNETTEYGYIGLTKSVSSNSRSGNGLNLKPTGAVYSIFVNQSDASGERSTTNRIGYFTVNENGVGVPTITNQTLGLTITNNLIKVPLAQLQNGTYETKTFYLRETTRPTSRDNNNYEWIWDDTVYSLRAEASQTSGAPVKLSAENKYDEFVYAYITKSLNQTNSGINTTITYEIKNTTTNEKITRTVAISNGEMGQTSKIKLEPGTYEIKEISSSSAKVIVNSTPKTVTLRAGTHTFDNPYKAEFKNDTYPSLTLIKTTDRTDLDGNQFAITNSKFTLYTNSQMTNVAKTTSDNNAVLTVNSDGTTNTLYLEPGIYYIKETSVSSGFTNEPTLKLKVNGTTTEIKNGKIEVKANNSYVIEAVNHVKPGEGKVQKNY